MGRCKAILHILTEGEKGDMMKGRRCKPMARQKIYSDEEAKQRKMEYTAQWQKDNTTCINIRLTKPGKARLVAYAEWKGLPVATMLRDCAERCMVEDGWKYTSPDDVSTDDISGDDI